VTGTGGIGVVVVAAGSGTRLGSQMPKALVDLDGTPLLVHALTGLAEAGLPPAVVVCPPGSEAVFADAVAQVRVAAVVPGGATRTQSVRAGLAALGADVDIVVVHDAARPLMPPEVMRAAVDALLDADDVVAAAPALPVADTLKRTVGDTVVGTVPRDRLVAVQTPQVFPRALLDAALTDAVDATDDLALIEEMVSAGRATGRVVIVAGSVWGHKITFASDLAFAEAIAGRRGIGSRRAGDDHLPEAAG
jgi:2-C-methyl-D-erythritol 4-phosphate cytidylyltransferase